MKDEINNDERLEDNIETSSLNLNPKYFLVNKVIIKNYLYAIIIISFREVLYEI